LCTGITKGKPQEKENLIETVGVIAGLIVIGLVIGVVATAWFLISAMAVHDETYVLGIADAQDGEGKRNISWEDVDARIIYHFGYAVGKAEIRALIPKEGKQKTF
jgi:predicted branched-subunit amino acid permease